MKDEGTSIQFITATVSVPGSASVHAHAGGAG